MGISRFGWEKVNLKLFHSTHAVFSVKLELCIICRKEEIKEELKVLGNV